MHYTVDCLGNIYIEIEGHQSDNTNSIPSSEENETQMTSRNESNADHLRRLLRIPFKGNVQGIRVTSTIAECIKLIPYLATLEWAAKQHIFIGSLHMLEEMWPPSYPPVCVPIYQYENPNPSIPLVQGKFLPCRIMDRSLNLAYVLNGALLAKEYVRHDQEIHEKLAVLQPHEAPLGCWATFTHHLPREVRHHIRKLFYQTLLISSVLAMPNILHVHRKTQTLVARLYRESLRDLLFTESLDDIPGAVLLQLLTIVSTWIPEEVRLKAIQHPDIDDTVTVIGVPASAVNWPRDVSTFMYAKDEFRARFTSCNGSEPERISIHQNRMHDFVCTTLPGFDILCPDPDSSLFYAFLHFIIHHRLDGCYYHFKRTTPMQV